MGLRRFLRFDLSVTHQLIYNFNATHAFALYLIFVLVLFLWQFERRIVTSHQKNQVTTIFGYSLLFLPMIYSWVTASLGYANWQTDLPFHAPHVLSFVIGLSFLKGYTASLRRLFLLTLSTVLFFSAFPMVEPLVGAPLQFVLYYIQIGALIIALLWMVRHLNLKMDWHLFTSGLQWTLFVVLFFFAANLIMETNYFYVNHVPNTAWTPLVWLAAQPVWYVLSILAMTTVFYMLLFTLLAHQLVISTVKGWVKSND